MAAIVDEVKAICRDAIERALARYVPIERTTAIGEMLPERVTRFAESGKQMLGATSIRHDFNSEHFENVFEGVTVGDCMDPYIREGDIEWYSLNAKPTIGDIVMVHVPASASVFEHNTGKCLLAYKKKLLLASVNDPPVWCSSRWKLAGVLLALHRYPEIKRQPVPDHQQAILDRSAATSTADSYGWNSIYLQRVFGADFSPDHFDLSSTT